MSTPVVHFEIVGQDSQKLRDFYRQVFDWTLEEVPGIDYALIRSTGDGGIGGGIGAAGQAEGYATFYVQVDDPQASLERIERLGGKTVVPVTVVPDMVTFAMFTDPEGHLIGLVKASP